MTLEQERKFKAMAAEQCGSTQTPHGMLNTAYDNEPKRVCLRDRVQMDLSRAVRESNKLQRLQELTFLLDKNPEVARILDLIEEVRG